MNKIGDMGMAVGRTLASSAEKHLGDGEGGIVGGTIYILGSGITSASTVWIALENASKTMAKNIADETVDTVRHKYAFFPSICPASLQGLLCRSDEGSGTAILFRHFTLYCVSCTCAIAFFKF